GIPRRNFSGTPAMVAADRSSSSQLTRNMSVWVDPGETTLQRIPYFATSSAAHLASIVAADLEAEYAAIEARGVRAALDDTVTIAPPRRGIIRATTALIIR